MREVFLQQAKEFTRSLRLGTTPEMNRLRQLLQERGVDVGRTACVGAFDDYLDNFIGVLVLPSFEAVEFVVDYCEVGMEAANITGWHDAPNEYSERIQAGVELLESEAGGTSVGS